MYMTIHPFPLNKFLVTEKSIFLSTNQNHIY